MVKTLKVLALQNESKNWPIETITRVQLSQIRKIRHVDQDR